MPVNSRIEVLDEALFHLAASLYLTVPDEKTLTASQISTIMPDQPPEGDLNVIRSDYFNLFSIPISGIYISPYESFYREGCLWGESTRQITDLYSLSGFQPARSAERMGWSLPIVPDHLGLEMAFMGSLLRSRNKSIPGERELIEAFIEHMWDQHLSQWASRVGEKLISTARTPFYRSLGQLTMLITSAELFAKLFPIAYPLQQTGPL